MELIGRALKQVLFVLDQVTYGLIPSAYELIFYLSNVNLFNNEVLLAVINRVYLLLGIYMLFKVAFSMIRFLIDPNAFSDKSKGFGKLITNSLIAVVLLVMTPFIFEKAYELQSDIILSNAIPRLILGDTEYKDYTSSYNKDNKLSDKDLEQIKTQQSTIHSMGVDVQFAMFSAFYNLNVTDNVNGFQQSCAPTKDHPISNVLGSSDMIESGCWNVVQKPLTEELHSQGGTLTEIFKYKAQEAKISGEKCPDGICDERDFAGFSKLLWWAKAGGNSPSTINYTPIISAIAGGYLLLLLITFAIDIAIRVFKLLFLQTIAPIAIISYMDPSESTSNGKFHNWLVECGKTFASLFLRLAVIYLAILLVKIVTSSIFAAVDDSNSIYYNGVRPTDTMNMFVYVFLILGIFTFAKKVPQMVESIFGIKMSGELTLNPFKNPIISGAATAGLAGASAVAANALGAQKRIGSVWNKWREGGGLAGAKTRILDSYEKARDNRDAYNSSTFDDNANAANIELQRARSKGNKQIKRDRDNMRAAWKSGQITQQQYENYKEQNPTISEAKAKVIEAKAKDAKEKKKAREEKYKSYAEVGRSVTNVANPVKETVSAIAGVPAGGVSAAARAAIPGSKQQSPRGILDEANKARKATNEARTERDSQSDMARAGRYTAADRAHNAIYTKFAGVKGEKSYSEGKVGEQINDLTMEISNLTTRLSRANENVSNLLSARSQVTSVDLNDMFKRLDSAGSIEAREPIINDIKTYINTNSTLTATDKTNALSYVNAVETVDTYSTDLKAKQKELKKLEDVSNINKPKS